jgi:hypothetical protein
MIKCALSIGSLLVLTVGTAMAATVGVDFSGVADTNNITSNDGSAVFSVGGVTFAYLYGGTGNSAWVDSTGVHIVGPDVGSGDPAYHAGVLELLFSTPITGMDFSFWVQPPQLPDNGGNDEAFQGYATGLNASLYDAGGNFLVGDTFGIIQDGSGNGGLTTTGGVQGLMYFGVPPAPPTGGGGPGGGLQDQLISLSYTTPGEGCEGGEGGDDTGEGCGNAPEPGSYTLLGSSLLLLGFGGRKLAGRRS